MVTGYTLLQRNCTSELIEKSSLRRNCNGERSDDVAGINMTRGNKHPKTYFLKFGLLLLFKILWSADSDLAVVGCSAEVVKAKNQFFFWNLIL